MGRYNESFSAITPVPFKQALTFPCTCQSLYLARSTVFKQLFLRRNVYCITFYFKWRWCKSRATILKLISSWFSSIWKRDWPVLFIRALTFNLNIQPLFQMKLHFPNDRKPESGKKRITFHIQYTLQSIKTKALWQLYYLSPLKTYIKLFSEGKKEKEI